MRIGLAADHAGFELKQALARALESWGHEVVDFGARFLEPGDDYPDRVLPLARAVAEGRVDRGVAACGSGVGACVVANKVAGVRAAVIHDAFSARQGVEDDDVNLACIGARVLAPGEALDRVRVFLEARFSRAERHLRRLEKVRELDRRR